MECPVTTITNKFGGSMYTTYKYTRDECNVLLNAINDKKYLKKEYRIYLMFKIIIPKIIKCRTLAVH